MKNLHFGVNVLALVAVVLMVAAMYQPWWSFALARSPQTDVYPYLIDGPGSESVSYTHLTLPTTPYV